MGVIDELLHNRFEPCYRGRSAMSGLACRCCCVGSPAALMPASSKFFTKNSPVIPITRRSGSTGNSVRRGGACSQALINCYLVRVLCWGMNCWRGSKENFLEMQFGCGRSVELGARIPLLMGHNTPVVPAEIAGGMAAETLLERSDVPQGGHGFRPSR